jgi:hypothetical protein
VRERTESPGNLSSIAIQQYRWINYEEQS